MKRRHFFPCLLSAGLAFTLVSCSEDATTLFDGQGQNVTMTVNINRVGQDTRSVLTEENGDLICTWEATDLVLVVDKAGNKLGVLKLTSGAGDTNATFTGQITTTNSGNTDLNFLYLGSKTEVDLQAIESPVVLDYSAQDGTIDWLSKNDFFLGSKNVAINSSVINVESLSLDRKLAFGKFEMQLPEGVTYGGEDITVSGTGLYTKASISMTDNGCSFTDAGNITITPTKLPEGESYSNTFYLTVLPNGEEKITPTFSVTIDKKTYSCTLTEREWTSSQFVRKSNTDGTYTGVILDMTEKTPAYNPYEGYENEDPRNPLHKFAKYNLTRGENNLNVFVEDENAYGALYQWGRYYGFIDNKDKFSSTRYSLTSNSYIQFAEAVGERENSGTTDTWPYSVYDTDGDGQINNISNPYALFPTAPIVVGFNYYSTGNDVYFDYPRIYNSKDHLVVDQPYYMMPGEPGTLIGLYSLGNRNYVDEYCNSGDYWASAFGEGGSTWTDRSTKQGFAENKHNPCPDGWRLPTEAEMREIIPENGLYEPNGNLSEMVNNYCEIRQTENEVNYVIRWNYVSTNNYIEIEAVVVDDTYTNASQITTLFWDEHVSDKVVRIFPFTGGIRPFTGIVYGSTAFDTVICRPISMGAPSFDTKKVYFGWTSGILVTLNPNETGAINNHFGGYWVEDKNLAFKFCSGNFERKVNDNIHDEASEYTRIRMEETGPAFGMAIRPVMDTSTEETK